MGLLWHYRAPICDLLINDLELQDNAINILAGAIPTLGFWLSLQFFMRSLTVFLHRGNDATYTHLAFMIFTYGTIYYYVFYLDDGLDGLVSALTFGMMATSLVLIVLLTLVYNWQRLMEGILE